MFIHFGIIVAYKTVDSAADICCYFISAQFIFFATAKRSCVSASSDMAFRINEIVFVIIVYLFVFSFNLSAQTIYDLHKLTEDDWLALSTEERLNALNTVNQHPENQTFVGDFGRFYDLQKKWGYEYYEIEWMKP